LAKIALFDRVRGVVLRSAPPAGVWISRAMAHHTAPRVSRSQRQPTGRSMPALETTRLLLRPLALDDARHFTALFDGDWDAVRQTGRMPYPPTEAAIRRWIAGHIGARNHSFLLIRKEDRAVLGSGGFGGPARAAELGYGLGRAYWGRGYATEAVGAMLGYARLLGLRRLEAYSFVDNPASARVLEKAGFTDLGVITRNYPARGGQRDVRHYRKKL
jgi:RimJ/RimL family protein N-acetyltransferase